MESQYTLTNPSLEQVQLEDFETLPVLSNEDDELQKYLDDGIDAIMKSEEFKSPALPVEEEPCRKTSTFGKASINSTEDADADFLKQQLEEARRQLSEDRRRYSEELETLKRFYENKLSQVRRETTNQCQQSLERKMAALNRPARAGNNRAEIELDIKKELEQQLAQQLHEERERMYSEMKEAMSKESAMNKALSEREKELRNHVRRSEEASVRSRVEQEAEESVESAYVRMQEELKQSILDETMARVAEEMNEKYELEVEKLKAQVDKEVEENTSAIKREIENRLADHIEKLNMETEAKYSQEREKIKSICLK
eukprot:TRINITY_DN2508_c0_g1_i14.p1 TRINITY_DN2508_c0_g1~~TRINITY_DN2508_c0_g1_i14.p1  ORF type:complete len:314 (-),score=130.05 TRINITY_DN2508_c0_g1_i14:1000-1941(-)